MKDVNVWIDRSFLPEQMKSWYKKVVHEHAGQIGILS